MSRKKRIIPKKIKWIWLVLGFVSCSGRIIEYKTFKPLKNNAWYRTDTVRFQYTPEKPGLKNLYFYLENTEDYPYSNIFIIAKTRYDNKLIIDTLEYRMTDGHGRWLGKKVRNTVENLLVFKTGLQLEANRELEVSLEPATRRIDRIEGDSVLPGVAGIGLIVEPVKNFADEKENN